MMVLARQQRIARLTGVAGRGGTIAPSSSSSSSSFSSFFSARSPCPRGRARRWFSSLTTHPSFANTTVGEAGRHLGLLVGDKSEWRARGLPWRIYRPGLFPFGGSGREISTLEALERLSRGQPVRFQRCRSVTVTPDLKALEGLATTLAVPALRGLSQNVKDTKVVADPTGIELPHGRHTTLSSFAELKLFSSIYNLEVPLPSARASSSAEERWEKKEEAEEAGDQGTESLRIAHLISQLMNRDLASGLEMFSVEDRPLRRFLWYFLRDVAFWMPAALLVVTPALASETVMSAFGLEAMPMFPFSGVSSFTQYVETLPTVIEETARSGLSSGAGATAGAQGSGDGDAAAAAGAATTTLGARLCAYSVNVAGLVGAGVAGLRALWKTLVDTTPMGYKITAYEAFQRVARGEPVVLQQMMMQTFRVPFITTLSFFTPYRPGDVVSDVEDLETFANIHKGLKPAKDA